MTKNITARFLTVLLFISIPAQLFAWGKKGHGIVAEIAFAFLDSNTKQNVRHYLGSTTIEEASTWMDEMRGDHQYDYMKSWHYVNIDKGTQYEATKEPNVINALNKAIDNLSRKENLSDAEIKTNLMVIFHLVGDMHQPLHVGYRSDKGGNDIQVKYLGNSDNLHRVWDTEIIESEGITTDQCLLLYSTFDNSDREEFKDLNIGKWIYQPRSQLSKVYNFNHDSNVIDQAYVDKNKKIVELQLLIAGIRLASVLQKVAG